MWRGSSPAGLPCVRVPFSSFAAGIHLRGLGEGLPRWPTDPAGLEAAAREVLTDDPFGYVAAVGDRVAVLFDSGVRTGADAAVAVASGADAVLLGRPCAYGSAPGGEEGVRHVLRGVSAGLDLTLASAGYASSRRLRDEPGAVRGPRWPRSGRDRPSRPPTRRRPVMP